MARVKLRSGENTIDAARATRIARDTVRIQWSIGLPDGRVKRMSTQARTVGEARARAREKAKDLLSSQGSGGAWSLSSPLNAYIDAVTRRAIAANTKLAPRSVDRYNDVIPLLLRKCEGRSVSDVMTYRSIENLLHEIAHESGRANAIHCRTVLKKYVILPLFKDGVLDSDPISFDLSIPDVESKKRPRPERKALTLDEFKTVQKWLLEFDPEADVTAPKRGSYTREDLINVQRRLQTLTLLQMHTGLRINEALALRWDEHVEVTDDAPYMAVTITPEMSKTNRGRTIPVLDETVAKRLIAGREPGFVVGSPVDNNKRWDNSNASKKIRRFYDRIARECDVELLSQLSTHVWRATLNTLTLPTLPTAVRAAYFGHSEKINIKDYADKDMSPMAREVAKLLRG